MAVEGLNHFNLIAPQPLLQQVRDFYIDVVGLNEGYRPDFGIPGHWLYAGDSALLHLIDGDVSNSISGAAGGTGTGCLDHIAFTCSDFEGTERHLNALGIKYKKSEYPAFNLQQLFIQDPTGLGVEMNFTV